MQPTKLQLLGIAGTAGAGKDVVAEMMGRLYGAENLSSGDFVRAVARFIYRLPPDHNPVRDQLFEVATYLRTEINPSIMVKMCVLQAQAMNVGMAVITGLRTMGEAEAIRAAGGIIVGVTADPRLRYDRIFARQRDSEAKKSFEQFILQDEHENKGVATFGDLRGISTIIDSADVMIENNSTIDVLEAQLREKLGPLFAA